MNLIFHLVSAAAAVFLTLLMLRAQRQRSFLLMLMQSGQQRGLRRVVVDTPVSFLSRYAQACGLTAVDETGPKAKTLGPRRLDPGPWLELLLHCQPILIECLDAVAADSSADAAAVTRSSQLQVRVSVECAAVPDDLAVRLTAALGEQVRVEVMTRSEPQR